jgi:hypothetical protein
MKFLEKDLEDLIYNHSDRMEDKGLDLNRYKSGGPVLFRQVNLGSYGIADLINVEIIFNDDWKNDRHNKRRWIVINVIECKQGVIDVNAYMQAKRYVSGVKALYDKHNLKNTHLETHITLIGSDIQQNGDFVYAYSLDFKCSIYTYKYGVDGLEFDIITREWKPNPVFAKKPTFEREVLQNYRDYYYFRSKFEISNEDE